MIVDRPALLKFRYNYVFQIGFTLPAINAFIQPLNEFRELIICFTEILNVFSERQRQELWPDLISVLIFVPSNICGDRSSKFAPCPLRSNLPAFDLL